ncbi:MAG: hypothetical protein J6W72_03820 [Candidatus Methanomethylophilaceae archaeon]|nr:hypothetical protein [Candidatus Methanomethylophilaceae archaeon]MBP5685538.1 hypothetical protein [Candidatus Methanomethylophilaceae archaeon]
MLVCFAAAWPLSIYKQWKLRTSKGKSILFSYVVMLGYVFGIANKIVNDHINYVLAFYIFDLVLVLVDTAIYYRNQLYESRSCGKSECADDGPE